MISAADAEAAIRLHAPRLGDVSQPLLALSDCILRERIVATRDQPPFDRVTMDGIAFAMSSAETGRRAFRIAGAQAAGAAPLALDNPDECLEVMTGAVVPHGCDCVIPVEKITVRDGVAHLADDAAPARRLNIHSRGIDVRRGDRLLEAGARIGPAEMAVIASNGLTHVRVTRSPSIAVISTGDELVEPGRPVADWQIHRSNAYAVLSALQRRGLRALSHDHLPDDPEKLRFRLRDHLDANDVLILSGGVSMGRFDYVPQVLAELGVSVIFHKVAQRPGKPMWFGVGANGKAVYALPGNPVSTLVCLVRYVYPGLDAALGAPRSEVDQVALLDEFEVKPPLTVFIPAKVVVQGERRCVTLHPTGGSGDFISLTGTDGFVELPPGPLRVAAGAPVPFYRW